MKTINFLKNNDILNIADEDIQLFFSTKKGGVSKHECDSLNLAFHVNDQLADVLTNRQIYAEKINMDLNRAVFCQQTHSTNFKLVTHQDARCGSFDFESGINNCDALYTFEKNLFLNGYYADCTPVYFYSTEKNLIGIIHAGWQGTVKQITKKTLKHIIEKHNIKPDEISVVIGPSIGYEHFEVRKDVINLVLKMDNYKDCYKKINDQQYIVDVKRLNYLQCQDLGITNIKVSKIDTFSDDEMFSYRKNNKCGRMCATIVRS